MFVYEDENGLLDIRPYTPPKVRERQDSGHHHRGLDGLRAMALVGALLFHAGVLHGGFLGVDLFFVLSGFLITGLLLRDADTRGLIDLRRFWTRRARRLAPALLLVLAVVVFWTHHGASPSTAQTTSKEAGWSLVYLNNWFALFAHVGHWGVKATKTPLNHLWSLAIEEQFYLVWPVVVALIVRLSGSTRAVMRIALLAAVTSGTWQFWVAHHYGSQRAYLGTDTRASALFIGCLLAVILHRQDDAAAGAVARISPSLWSVAVVVAAGGLVVSWVVARLDSPSLYGPWLLSCGIAAAVLIAAVVTNPVGWYTELLSTRPLVWVGKRSYSLYLWHWPIWVLLSPSAAGAAGAELWAVRLLVTMAVSMASYSWVEQPIRESRLSGPPLVASFAVPALALGLVIRAVPPKLPAALGSDPVALGGSGHGGLRILLAGDSWARNMGYGLALADGSHRNTYLNLGAGGCGIAPGQKADCLRQVGGWAQAVTDDHPDAALLMTGTVNEDVGAVIGGVRVLPCDALFDGSYAAALDQAIAVLHGQTNVPVYLTTVRNDEYGFPARSDCMNRLLLGAAKRNSATLLDLHGNSAQRAIASPRTGVKAYTTTPVISPRPARSG